MSFIPLCLSCVQWVTYKYRRHIQNGVYKYTNAHLNHPWSLLLLVWAVSSELHTNIQDTYKMAHTNIQMHIKIIHELYSLSELFPVSYISFSCGHWLKHIESKFELHTNIQDTYKMVHTNIQMHIQIIHKLYSSLSKLVSVSYIYLYI